LPAGLVVMQASGQECPLHTGKTCLVGPFIIERFSVSEIGSRRASAK
jgi:hypothetical protein